MALTLVEAAKKLDANGEVYRAAIVELYARESDILQVLPIDNIAGNALRYNQEDSLPGIGFRGVNEGYTESTGVINPQSEHLVIAGGDLDVDKFITRTMGAGHREAQEAMKVKHLAHKISHSFIKGDSLTDPKEFDGLQVRLTGNQIIEATAGAVTDGGDALELGQLDEAIDAVDSPTHLLMSKAMRRKFTAAARDTGVAGYVNYVQDTFGRTQTTYNDIPIIIADRNSDVYATLAFNEVAGTGATATATSIYVLGLGQGMLQGIQNGTMMVDDLGELDTKPVFRTRVEWYVSMALMHPRSAARLRGILNAAIV